MTSANPPITDRATDDSGVRLTRISQRYADDGDVQWLIGLVEPRHARIARRDAAVRAARALFPGPPTTQARMLSAALSAYQRTDWLVEKRLPALPSAVERHALLHLILRLNGGRPLAYRRIMDIFK